MLWREGVDGAANKGVGVVVVVVVAFSSRGKEGEGSLPEWTRHLHRWDGRVGGGKRKKGREEGKLVTDSVCEGVFPSAGERDT